MVPSGSRRQAADNTPSAERAVVLENFLAAVSAVDRPRVLELGTKRSDPSRSTLHRDWVPNASEYLGTDIEPGEDVDCVADVHFLSETFTPASFDVVVSCSTFEHLQYPWLAAEEIARVLRPGGYVFVQTHQSFPLHAYPCDYWRFTRQALEALFCPGLGFEVLGTEYVFPCRIASVRDPAVAELESYLNVHLLARRAGGCGALGEPDWRSFYRARPRLQE